MSEAPYRAILIAGPTASGKSGLALTLAERLGGTVINADSMQVYRELRVLTARPPAEDEARAPHRLYGHVPGREAYSAGQFVREAASAIREARDNGRMPIVVGGTGLYFKALLEGLSPIPAISPDVRARWREEAERIGAGDLHRKLAELDPVMAARLRPTDPQRITRALEVLDETGRSLSDWQSLPGEPVVPERETVRLVIRPEREDLYRRCDARLDAMMATGAIAEVAALAELRLDPALPVMRALGVAPLLRQLAGDLSPAEALQQAKTETRRYAKRQLTWLRRNMISWTPVLKQQMQSDVSEIVSMLRTSD